MATDYNQLEKKNKAQMDWVSNEYQALQQSRWNWRELGMRGVVLT
jgi:hypothetical protein